MTTWTTDVTTEERTTVPLDPVDDAGIDGEPRPDGEVESDGEAERGVTTHRHSSRWLDSDYAELVTLLGENLADLDIACLLGRTLSSIRRRIAELVPADLGLPRSQQGSWLRDQLQAEPPLDWRAVLRERHRAANRRYFDHRDDQLLRTAWATCRPMPELSEALTCDEFVIAQHLINLRVATSLAEVVDRLGVTGGNELDQRVRLVRERLGTAVHILIVDGLDAGRHVSVHPDANAGLGELDRLRRRHEHNAEQAGRPAGPLTWTLAERTVAGGNTGATEHNRSASG